MSVTTATAPSGKYIGVQAKGVVAWRGIRFATARRFNLPEPAAPLAEPQLCASFGPACPQESGLLAKASALGSMLSEDCLMLNIYSPGADASRRPVMVWVHGGAFLSGSGAIYDGAILAAAGDAVIVTVNYRLGALGFADFSALGGRRNLGLFDQIAALQWVKENIAAFGGDPKRVTLAGESAGAISIALLMLAPAAAGMFHRAILQSGGVNLIHDADIGRRLGERYRERLGEAGASLEALRALPAERLVQTQQAIGLELQGTIAAGPIYDGELLPTSVAQANDTAAARMPIIAGSMRDEIRLFELQPLRRTVPISREMILDRVERTLGRQARERIAGAYASSKTGVRQLGGDANFTLPTRHFAERHAAAGNPAWVYRFDEGGMFFGPTHGVDLFYLWPLRGLTAMVMRGGPMLGARARLARRMQRFWINFMRHGDPGSEWTRYLPATRATLLFDVRDTVMRDPDAERRQAWEGRVAAMAHLP